MHMLADAHDDMLCTPEQGSGGALKGLNIIAAYCWHGIRVRVRVRAWARGRVLVRARTCSLETSIQDACRQFGILTIPLCLHPGTSILSVVWVQDLGEAPPENSGVTHSQAGGTGRGPNAIQHRYGGFDPADDDDDDDIRGLQVSQHAHKPMHG